MDTSSTASLRRTPRQKKPSLKALESMYVSKLKTSGFVADPSSDDEYLLNMLSDDDFSAEEVEKPKLLHENDAVRGEDMFAFEKRKQNNGLTQKVVETNNQKTPYAVRKKIKSKIAAKILEYSSGSEYECSSEDSESDESETSQSSNSDDSSEQESCKYKRKTIRFENVKLQNKGRGRKAASDKYTIQTDEYFSNCGSNKVKTSNNTLDKLETPRLPQYQLQKLLSNMKLSKEHEKALRRFEGSNKKYFKKWLYLLHENFNILLFGLGSKKEILRSFQKEYLNDFPVIVVNGFFPSISIKNIIDGILVDLFEHSESPGNINEACDLIITNFNNFSDLHLYLIIHNLEGETLRNSKTQNVLARLAAVRNIHLITSIDHINAPLIWDHHKLSKFKFIWWDVTSYLPYTDETSYERSIMVQQSGALALSSLRNVFLSLTTNSKAIYLKIVKHQLENTSQYYQGYAFKDLYMSCRESYIVSSDLALRAQLTEFVDHKMVKLKRGLDGTEYLTIPLANNLLQKFLEENS